MNLQVRSFDAREITSNIDVKNLYHNPVVGFFQSAVSLFIPNGELFFINTLRSVKSDLNDQQMQDEIDIFIHQESNHRTIHKLFNRKLFEVDPFLKRVEKEHLKIVNLDKHIPKKSNLATVCAVEHFTALWCQWMLSNDINKSANDPGLGKFMDWHSIEEVEHVQLVGDCAERLKISYLQKFWGFYMCLWLFLIPMALVFSFYILRDKRSYSVPGVKNISSFIFGKTGIFSSIVVPFFEILKPKNQKFSYFVCQSTLDRVEASLVQNP